MAPRFGVLGTGYWAQEAHATALAASDQADLVAIWGRDPAKTAAAAERFGVAGHTDLDRLLAEVDAVAIAVPPDVQAELALRAAAAGRHLLLDKPLALSLDAADRVAAAVGDAGVASLVFFTLRFLPEVAAWMEEAEAAGDWHGGDGAWLGTALEPGSPFAGSPWRRRKGALWDLGPHLLALAIPTLGPVERVTAGTGLGDTVHLVLGHQGGASSTLTLSQTVPAPAEGRSFQLYGPKGRSRCRRSSSPTWSP
jgi:predicted dehydrogenase